MNAWKITLFVIFALRATYTIAKIGEHRPRLTPADAQLALIGWIGLAAMAAFA